MQTIYERLNKLEIEHSCKILLAVEAGSRMYGFNKPDSDYDIRFIYKKSIRINCYRIA